uniref:7TM_GPCR_Srx domain-containing protein n=1 Tax=Caenorhabditis tropicalis TaxID=1561998 RepID=A0A1I7UAT9_9PELO
MNIATFSKIYFFYKSTETEQKEMRRKSRKNKVLFCQTVFEDGIMLIDMLFTFKLSSLSDSRYWTFISVTFVWQSVHSVDGFVMVMFNERLSFLKRKLFGNLDEQRTNIQMMTTVVH